MNRQLEIYKTLEGEVIFDIDREQETIWATQAQIAKLFGVNQPAIAKHLKNIFENLSRYFAACADLSFRISPNIRPSITPDNNAISFDTNEGMLI